MSSNCGHILIDTPEKQKACEPKRETDEFKSSDGRWLALGPLGASETRFDPNFIYRRPISAGEGCEIVKEDEARGFDGLVKVSGIEYTKNGGDHWFAVLYPIWEETATYRRRMTKPASANSNHACPVAQRVADRIQKRAELGLNKYGTNLTRDDLSLIEWLQHAQDELLDGAVYLERLKEEVGKIPKP